MAGRDIFISYCREERATARLFAESFAQEGLSVWWDAVLRSGETFDEVIERELRAAKAVVVLWSPRSVASRWVRAEATLADRGNKMVPVIIESCNLPIIFELTHAADLSNWTGDTTDIQWRTLVEDLRRLVSGDEEAALAQLATELAAEPKPVAKLVDAPGVAPEQAASPAHSDELIQALERLSRAQESDLSKPTPLEEEQAQFYKRSDEFRLREGDRIHCLLRLDGEQQETRFVVTANGLGIGRSAPSDIIVSGLGVSRAHCLVELAPDQVRVTDLNSTNGTYIDNKRIDRSAILPIGGVLRVGTVSFEHEVRTRAEMLEIQRQIDLAAFDSGTAPFEARLARN